nr:biotin carboxylase N-terminal domain-containing protein [uncultured Draconibacterium sp.]
MKIQSILIANRGEIAVRIIKTAQRMGIKTYAFQTPQEANAVYLNWADEIIALPEEKGNKIIFLDAEAIVRYAKELTIDAIHPGYGFLAENPELPQLCKKEGILFIGPDEKHLRQMGNKNEARLIAEKAGVPIVKGSKTPANTLNEVKIETERIGFPVILKALAGGGGKGMRVVKKEAELEMAYKMAVNEAQNAFGNSQMIVEKYIENPRHIEIQVLADQKGNAVHLYERECSIQRNHQKLLEEAPSKALSDELRDKMCKHALALVRATGYFTLGTVEFLLDSNRDYYFMEMNTRIQVEHPVTEAITGLDLVELQIRTAAGDKLPFEQTDIKCNGWAIEFRINAEDVQTGFTPDFGIIDEMNFPAYPGLRVDTGFIPSSVIPNSFDSLLAKLIIAGRTREQVIQKSFNILNHSRVVGVKTTIPFFKALLQHPDFVSGNITTSFINKMGMLFFQEKHEEEAAAMIALQAYLDDLKHIEISETTPEHTNVWISRMWNKLF